MHIFCLTVHPYLKAGDVREKVKKNFFSKLYGQYNFLCISPFLNCIIISKLFSNFPILLSACSDLSLFAASPVVIQLQIWSCFKCPPKKHLRECFVENGLLG